MKNLKVRQFDVQEWLDNPAILVCTREGHEANVRNYYPERMKPITFSVGPKDEPYDFDTCSSDGKCTYMGDTINDLFVYSYESEDEFEEHFGPSQEELRQAIYNETHKNN